MVDIATLTLWACSSISQSAGLISRGLWVQIPPCLPECRPFRLLRDNDPEGFPVSGAVSRATSRR